MSENEKNYSVKYIPTGIIQQMPKRLVDEVMNIDPNNWEVLDDSYVQKTEEEKPTLLEIMTDEVGEDELKPTTKENLAVEKAEAKSEGKNKDKKENKKAEAKSEGK